MPPASGKGPRITVPAAAYRSVVDRCGPHGDTDARGTHARFRNVLAREKLGGCLEPGTDCIRRRRAAIDEDARVQYNPGSLAGLGGTGPRTDAGGTVADSHDDSRARAQPPPRRHPLPEGGQPDNFVLDDATLDELRGFEAILLGAIGPATVAQPAQLGPVGRGEGGFAFHEG